MLPQKIKIVGKVWKIGEIFKSKIKDKYIIFDENNNKLFCVHEESTFFSRVFLGNSRKLVLKILRGGSVSCEEDKEYRTYSEDLILEIKKDSFSPTFNIFKNNKRIGYITEKDNLFNREFHIYNDNDQLLFFTQTIPLMEYMIKIYHNKQEFHQKNKRIGEELANIYLEKNSKVTDPYTIHVDFKELDERSKEYILPLPLLLDMFVFNKAQLNHLQ